VVHLLRNSFRYASRKDWATIARDLRPIYTAPTEAAALEALASFAAAWEARYPAIIRLWEHAWAEFVPFLTFDAEIRTIIATTNAIESLGRAVPPLGQGPRPLPQRAGRAQAPVFDHRQPGPHRPRPPALDQPLEGRAERLRHRLRRARQRRQEVALSTPVTPFA
jgi:hypothetical protein